MVSELKHKLRDPTKILFDNKTPIAWQKNMIFQSGNKYISIKLHYIGNSWKFMKLSLSFVDQKIKWSNYRYFYKVIKCGCVPEVEDNA